MTDVRQGPDARGSSTNVSNGSGAADRHQAGIGHEATHRCSYRMAVLKPFPANMHDVVAATTARMNAYRVDAEDVPAPL
jgi:hypothetical protein